MKSANSVVPISLPFRLCLFRAVCVVCCAIHCAAARHCARIGGMALTWCWRARSRWPHGLLGFWGLVHLHRPQSGGGTSPPSGWGHIRAPPQHWRARQRAAQCAEGAYRMVHLLHPTSYILHGGGGCMGAPRREPRRTLAQRAVLSPANACAILPVM